MTQQPIIVVSGLPRSGTSMMMQMLAAGGLDIAADGKRAADASNPKGYYELDKVKSLREDNSWLAECEGRVVKVVSPMLQHMPENTPCKVVFMLRPIAEVLASQQAMMRRMGKGDDLSDADMEVFFSSHLARVKEWLTKRRNMDVLYVDYRQCLANPTEWAQKVQGFLSKKLDTEAMSIVVDPALHREKA